MSELDELLQAFGDAGGDKTVLAAKDIAHLVVSGRKLLSMKGVEGIEVNARRTLSGVRADGQRSTPAGKGESTGQATPWTSWPEATSCSAT